MQTSTIYILQNIKINFLSESKLVKLNSSEFKKVYSMRSSIQGETSDEGIIAIMQYKINVPIFHPENLLANQSGKLPPFDIC